MVLSRRIILDGVLTHIVKMPAKLKMSFRNSLRNIYDSENQFCTSKAWPVVTPLLCWLHVFWRSNDIVHLHFVNEIWFTIKTRFFFNAAFLPFCIANSPPVLNTPTRFHAVLSLKWTLASPPNVVGIFLLESFFNIRKGMISQGHDKYYKTRICSDSYRRLEFFC